MSTDWPVSYSLHTNNSKVRLLQQPIARPGRRLRFEQSLFRTYGCTEMAIMTSSEWVVVKQFKNNMNAEVIVRGQSANKTECVAKA